MRYWVYINDEVLPQPYEAEALSSIPGFDAQTLICPEETPEGGNQEWTSAGELINYGAHNAVQPEETVETAQNDEQDIYDASGEYTPEPLPESYGREDSAEAYSQKEQILAIDEYPGKSDYLNGASAVTAAAGAMGGLVKEQAIALNQLEILADLCADSIRANSLRTGMQTASMSLSLIDFTEAVLQNANEKNSKGSADD